MNSMEFDTLVIGGGLSGLVAAASSAAEGRRVGLVSAGAGDLHLFSGCVDLLACYRGFPESGGRSPDFLLDKLIAGEPSHPYSLVGGSWIDESVKFFKNLLPEWEYHGDWKRWIMLPTSMGTVKRTGLAPRAMSAGDLEESGGMLLVGFRGVTGYSAVRAAENLKRSADYVPEEGLRGEDIELDSPAARPGVTITALARRLEQKEVLDSIVEKVRPLVRDAARVGFPPIMGLLEDLAVRDYLEDKIGVRVFEVPGSAPSIPGQRLLYRLHSALVGLGVKVMMGSRVKGAAVDRGLCLSVFAARRGEDVEIRAENFILASGGIRGGGITSDRSGLKEPLFGLPVRGPAKREDWFGASLFDPGGHPLDRAGVAADKDLLPVGAAGEILFENLRICGRIMAGQDPVKEKSGGGAAAASGYKAGKLSSVV